jgi:glutathione S-transferase
VGGDTYTLADCVAFSNLPLVGMATRAVYGEDLLIAGGVDYKPYVKMLGERPSSQKVNADRKAALTKP